MAEHFTDDPAATSVSPRRFRRWWIAMAVLFLVVVAAVVFERLRRPADAVSRRVAEIFNEARQAERNQGRLANFARTLPGPMAAVGEWFFPQSQKGTYEFAEELGKLGSNTAPILIEHLVNDRSPIVREVSAMALGDLGAVAALPVLTNVLAADAAFAVREAAIDALEQIGDAAALPAVLHAMRAETNESVRASAVMAAARFGGPAVASELLAAARLERDSSVRINFARALANAQEARAISLFASWLDAQSADDATVSSRYGLRQHEVGPIIEAVGELGGEPAYELLTNYWSQAGGKEIRESLCRAFGTLGDARALPLLQEALTEGKPTRAAAAEAMGQLGDTNALPALLLLAEDADQEVRGNAFTSIGHLGNESALPTLITAMESPTNRELRADISEALGQIGDPTALEPILAVFADNPRNREKVLWALGHLGHSNAIPTLASVLYSTERGDSFAAAYGLAEIGGDAAAEALAANLEHKDEFTRHGKACALAMLGRTNGLATVRQSLVAREEWRRFGATLALARLGLPPDAAEWKPILQDRNLELRRLGQAAAAGRIVPALVELLQSPDENFRHYAARGLVFFRDAESLPALRAACRDRNQQVRTAARLAVNFIERVQRSGN